MSLTPHGQWRPRTPPNDATVRARAYALWEQDQSRSSEENWRLAEEQLAAEYVTAHHMASHIQAEERHTAYIEMLDADERDETSHPTRRTGETYSRRQ